MVDLIRWCRSVEQCVADDVAVKSVEVHKPFTTVVTVTKTTSPHHMDEQDFGSTQ